MEETSMELRAEEPMAKTYFADLGLSWSELKGKKVLDLGAGLADFTKEAKIRGIEIISVDRHPEWHQEQGKPTAETPYVIGDGLNLPFVDESFDLIVSRAAVHSMVNVKEDLEKVMDETQRVLKKGGEFRFGPGSIMVHSATEDEWKSLDSFYQKIEKEGLNETEEAEMKKIQDRIAGRSKEVEEEEKQLENVTVDTERAKIIKHHSLKRLKNINPNITEHQGDPLMAPYLDIYYKMVKPNDVISTPLKK